MPTFQTPDPIDVTLNLHAAHVRITASDRDTTTVEVRPGSSNAKSRRMVEETRVEYADGRLTVRTPKSLASLFGRTGLIDVEIAVPAGSRLDGDTGAGDLQDRLRRTAAGHDRAAAPAQRRRRHLRRPGHRRRRRLHRDRPPPDRQG